METNNELPRGSTKDYYHVTDWERHFNKNILPVIFSFGSDGPPKGYTDYIKFYEGMIEDGNKKALFFLEYDKAGENEVKYIELSARVLLADCHHVRSKDTNELGCTRFDNSIAASQIFEYLGVPEDLWDKKGLSIIRTYYNKLAEGSRITVPGYLLETFFGNNETTSKVISIPRSNREGLKEKLREKGLKGEIRFW